MFDMILCALALLMWWFGVGPVLMVLNGIAHSDTNMLKRHAKGDGKSTAKYTFYQFVHCCGYVVWVIGLISITVLFKIF